MTVHKLSLGELVATTQELKQDIAGRLPDFEELRAHTEQWRSQLTYDNLKARGERLASDVANFAVSSVSSAHAYATSSVSSTRAYASSSVSSARACATSSVSSARALVRTSPGALDRRLRRAATSTTERLLWAARAYALLCLGAAYWLAVAPLAAAYVFVVDVAVSVAGALGEHADVLRFASEVVLSLLSAFQRSVCWILAYIRHREKCVACSTRYLAANDVEIYGFVLPRRVNEEALAWLPAIDALVAPALDHFVDLLLVVRPDNCGQLDHKNDRYECWVQDGGDKLRVMPARSNCPVAAAANLHRRIQQQRAALAKAALGLDAAKES